MSRRALVVVAFLVAGVSLAACGGESTGTSPIDRAVSLSTTACGDASRTSGSGVIVEDEWVVASAHVVIGAGSVTVTGPFGTGQAAVVVLDVDADIALLHVPLAQASPVTLSDVDPGDSVSIRGSDATSPMDATVERKVDVRIEAVRSTERISRLGYEVDVRVALGDSGGGVYDDAGNLTGLVFGRTLDRDASFIVRREPLEGVLARERAELWECDADQHRLIVVE